MIGYLICARGDVCCAFEAVADVYHDLDHVNRQGRCLMAGRKSLPRAMTFKLIPKSFVRILRGLSIERAHIYQLSI